MNKKGFTLVELLAVIVILAIIALISTPMILNVIDNAKKGAAKSSFYGYLDALEIFIVESNLKNNNKINLISDETYYINKSTVINSIHYPALNDFLELKGKKATGTDDYITLDSKKQVVDAKLTIDGYIIEYKEREIASIVKGEKIKVDNIILNYKNQVMEKGSSFKIIATFSPIDASDQRLIYVSTDENIITVDTNGNVTAKNVGKAKVIVKSKDDESKMETCDIEVIVSAESVSIDKENIELKIGEKIQLNGILKPSDTTTNALKWSSENENIALVNDNGLVTGISKGETTIKAETANGKIATSKVVVKEIEAENVSLDKENITMEVGDILTIEATIYPENTTNKKIIWTSSDNEVATVSEGIITAKKSGSTIIKATTSNGYEAYSNVIVYNKPNYGTSIASSYSDIYLKGTTVSKVEQSQSFEANVFGNFKNVYTFNSIFKNSNFIVLNSNVESQNDCFTYVNTGENKIELSQQPSPNSLIDISIRAGGATTDVYISDFKLNFSDGSSLTLNEAVTKEYIYPLVIVGAGRFSDILNILDGGKTSSVNYPDTYIFFKLKDKSSLVSYQFYSSRYFDRTYDGTYMLEVKDLDFSISPF